MANPERKDYTLSSKSGRTVAGNEPYAPDHDVEVNDIMAGSKSTKSPAFQFYPDTFLADANVAIMSLQERGAYITLICYCWQQGSLPNDHEILARLCGVPVTTFRKLWPAVSRCFTDRGEHLVHGRLEIERRKQRAYREIQAKNGKLGGRPRKAPQESDGLSTETQRFPEANQPTKAKESSLSLVSDSDLRSLDSGQKPEPKADARSKRPIFKGTRFVVFEWQLDDLRRMLGAHANEFDLHSWFFDLNERAEGANLVVPQRDGGKWLQEQTLSEAVRRGLPVAATTASQGKTAGNVAAAARFVARGGQS